MEAGTNDGATISLNEEDEAEYQRQLKKHQSLINSHPFAVDFLEDMAKI